MQDMLACKAFYREFFQDGNDDDGRRTWPMDDMMYKKTINTSVLSRNIVYIYIRGDSYSTAAVKIRISIEQYDVQEARTITPFLEPIGPMFQWTSSDFMVDCWAT